MATNPRIPEERPAPRHPKLMVPKRQFPWPLFAIVVAALILAAIIAYMPRAPKAKAPPVAAQVPPQPTGSQIQLTNLKISEAPTGGAVNLDGMLINNGNSSINGIAVDLTFKNSSGQALATQRDAVREIVVGKQGNGLETEPLTQAPIQPRQQRAIRIEMTQVPGGWDHHIPEMRIVTVTGARP